jgi:hypothetical protein
LSAGELRTVLDRLSYPLPPQGGGPAQVTVMLNPDRLQLRLHPCAAAPIQAEMRGTGVTLHAGEAYDVPPR